MKYRVVQKTSDEVQTIGQVLNYYYHPKSQDPARLKTQNQKVFQEHHISLIPILMDGISTIYHKALSSMC